MVNLLSRPSLYFDPSPIPIPHPHPPSPIPIPGPQERLGYDSTWRKRPRPSSADGCCLAWRRQLFELCAEESVEFVAGPGADGLKKMGGFP